MHVLRAFVMNEKETIKFPQILTDFDSLLVFRLPATPDSM
jgi:hypothetical protein